MKTKIFSSEIRALADRQMEFLISTDAVDRDGDMIRPSGWELENYKRSPVVLWGHDYSIPPIGRAASIVADGKGLRATVEFPPRGIHPLADQVHDLVKSGFLNACSVGFIPKEARPTQTGQDITQAELLEFSIVSVPSNPQALVTQRAYDRTALKSWFGDAPSDTKIDWSGINRQPDIDWATINRQLAGEPEVTVTADDVRRVVGTLAPMFRAGVRAALKAQIEHAVAEHHRYLTGRLD